MTVSLFDFIDALFDKEEYKKIPDPIKRKHFFMTQRFMSIKFPVEANNFNVLNINQVAVMNFWHLILSKRFNRKPTWLFTKTKKSKDKNKSDFDKFDPKLIRFYLKGKKLDRRDFDFLKEMEPESLFKELKSVEGTVKDNSIKL